jgi:hypothetical protein
MIYSSKQCFLYELQMSVDLVHLLFAIVSYVSLIILLREMVGPFHNDLVALTFLAFLQFLHLMLLILALCLQLSTLFCLYFGDRFLHSDSRFDFKHSFRIACLISSLSGSIVFCKVGAGFCNSTPFFFYLLDNTGMKTNAIRDKIYVPFLAIFFALVIAIQVSIERRKRKLIIADKLSKITASLAVNRLQFALTALQINTTVKDEKDLNIHKSSPCICFAENEKKNLRKNKHFEQKSFDSFTHKIFLRKFVGEKQKNLKKIPESQRVYSIQIEVKPSSFVIDFNYLSNFSQVKHQCVKRTQSCPEFTSLPNLGRHLRTPNSRKDIKQTRTLSIFLMIPTLMFFAQCFTWH